MAPPDRRISITLPAEIPAEDSRRIQELVNTPGPSASSELAQFARRYPGLLDCFGDTVGRAQSRLIEQLASGNTGVRAAIAAECVRIRDEHGFQESPAMERRLINLLVITWLCQTLALTQKRRAEDDGDVKRIALWGHEHRSYESSYARGVLRLAKIRQLLQPPRPVGRPKLTGGGS